MSAVLSELVAKLRANGYRCRAHDRIGGTTVVWDGPGGDRIIYVTDKNRRMTAATINALPVNGPDRPGKLLRYLRTATSSRASGAGSR